MKNKRGQEINELVKIVIAVVVLVILIAGVTLLLKGKGGEMLSTIKDIFRFGG